jgi:hypothetical protein
MFSDKRSEKKFYKNYVLYNIVSSLSKIIKYNFKSPIIVNYTVAYKLIKSIILKKKIDNKSKNYNYKNKNYFSYNDWFSYHAQVWLYFLKKENVLSNKKINYLEIGCFEGRSSLFILENIKNVSCDFIDTFKGGLEHKEIDFDQVLKNFKNNTKNFKKNINLYKMNSETFFKKKNNTKNYDLIYIDGSHEAKDVYHDAINSFLFLKKNGIIIFDDLFWDDSKDIKLRPITALLYFLTKYFRRIEILYLNEQLIIKKK